MMVPHNSDKTHTFLSASEAQSAINRGARLLDLFPAMWSEWFKLDKIPPPDSAEIALAFNEKWGNIPPLQRGENVHYPHSNSLITLLPLPEFVALRTARNRYKITPEEQHLLAQKRVGIVGLSVGRSVAITIAMERSCGLLRVADFDTLDLSNLNRIKAPLMDLGLPKTESLAREIAGLDPYFKLACFEEGLTLENMHDFMTRDGKLDILIDECDSLALKVLMRFKAKELGIPVVMDTSDRGMIDIERYDLEPNYPIFHGRLGNFSPADDWNPNREELQKLFADIVDIQSISDRGKRSLAEIGKTITTWPQLASAVSLGAGATAHMVRKILLNQSQSSGRYYIDIDELII
jgi:molybdopterin/thiamine biosynthesis adenylyltransferase